MEDLFRRRIMQDEQPIERTDTGIRILLSILFLLIAEVLRIVLGVTTAFCLAWTLATKRPPRERVRHFANRVLSYQYRLSRYLTYNEATQPFPFADFPAELEPPGPPHEQRSME